MPPKRPDRVAARFGHVLPPRAAFSTGGLRDLIPACSHRLPPIIHPPPGVSAHPSAKGGLARLRSPAEKSRPPNLRREFAEYPVRLLQSDPKRKPALEFSPKV